MANPTITVSSKNGVLVPSECAVSVVEGSGFTIQPLGTAVTLFFSPDAVAIRSPAPREAVTITNGGTASFTFTSSAEGAYSVFLEPNAASGPACFPPRRSNQLLIEVDLAEVGFSAQGDSMKTG